MPREAERSAAPEAPETPAAPANAPAPAPIHASRRVAHAIYDETRPLPRARISQPMLIFMASFAGLVIGVPVVVLLGMALYLALNG